MRDTSSVYEGQFARAEPTPLLKPGSTEAIECPLCLGEGELSRAEVLERLGVKDFARVAQLSAEEAIRLLIAREKDDEQARWTRFDSELARRLAATNRERDLAEQRLKVERDELETRLKGTEATASVALANAREQERLAAAREFGEQLTAMGSRIAELEAAGTVAGERGEAEAARVRAESERELNREKSKAADLARQERDHLEEIGLLRERNHTLQSELAKVARVGRREEMDFAEEARAWPGVWLGEKLARNGDFLMALSDAAGNPLDPVFMVENKDKSSVAQADIRKLVVDAKARRIGVAVLVVHDESQLRQLDRQKRWAETDGIWLLRSTRAWLQRDLDILRPMFERMRSEGPEFLERNAALAEEVRRTLADIDEIDGQLERAESAIGKARELAKTYRKRISALCEKAVLNRALNPRRGRRNPAR